MLERRAFLVRMASVVAAPLAVEAQQAPAKTVRVGRLSPVSAANDAALLEAFRQGLRDLGWVEGQNFTLEKRFAEGNPDRLPDLAAQLVQLRVNVILAGSIQGAQAARNATATIPVVVVMSGDPVASGLVASLARP